PAGHRRRHRRVRPHLRRGPPAAQRPPWGGPHDRRGGAGSVPRGRLTERGPGLPHRADRRLRGPPVNGPAVPRLPGWVEAFWSQPWLLALVGGVVVALAVAAVLARAQLAGWRHARWVDGARWVRIAAPPEVEPSSAAALWTTLAGVLTPSRWQRLLH